MSDDTSEGRAPRPQVLGVEVDDITLDELIAQVVSHAAAGRRLWVANHNLHSAYLVRDDPAMRRWYELADLIFVDGMSLVAASRLVRGPLRRAHRATVLDWMPQVLDGAVRQDLTVAHLGGHPDWIERGRAAWCAAHPGLDLWLHDGFFDPAESSAVVTAINEAAPDLLFVGMGMPRQERWLAEHAPALRVPVIATVGAALGYAAGATSTPPRWTGQVGLEWAWRLAADPRRLARRYLLEPALLAWDLGRSRLDRP